MDSLKPSRFSRTFPVHLRGAGNFGKGNPPKVPVSGNVGKLREADAETHWHWIISYQFYALEIFTHPPTTKAKVRKQYPDAWEIEPFDTTQPDGSVQ